MRLSARLAFAVRTALAAAAGALAGLGPAGAFGATAAVGMLTLDYDQEAWRVEPAARGIHVRCIAPACDGVVVEATAIPAGDSGCTRQAAYAAARAAFPFADRHAVNGFAVGSLYLILAASRDGPLLSNPSAAYACVARAGVLHEFRSDPGSDSPHPGHAGIVHALLGGLEGPPGAFREEAVGALIFAYRDDLWRIASTAGETYRRLDCLPPTCPEGAAVTILATGDPAACARDFERHGSRFLDAEVDLATAGGLSFRMQQVWMGCRNATPPILLACMVHEGVAYSFATHSPGCRTGPDGVPVAAFRELVESVRLRNP